MNTFLSYRKSALAGLAAVVLLTLPTVSIAEAGYVAHEWGTFTSVQGRDGVQLEWQALQVSELPGFVYDWTRPGLGRKSTEMLLLKTTVITKQRMETPVIYFYADQPETVDVTVRFPRGKITEWFPQAYQIGPAAKAESWAAEYSASKSLIRWDQVQILPVKKPDELAQLARLIPTDRSGSHYFAARETDSAFLAVPPHVKASPEREKFLFYRGAGNFPTPLHVSMNSNGELTVTNGGADPLPRLFVLEVRDGRGNLAELDGLASGGVRTIRVGSNDQPMDALIARLGKAMAEALVSEGLYPREATAMVNTWKDSWFAEDGTRVLYLLPRAWTDDTLPLTLAPPPRDLVRVMVGRAEVIPPSLELKLREQVTRAGQGDVGARAQVSDELKRLGRFAQPAMQLAARGLDAESAKVGWAIFSSNMQVAALKPAKAAGE